MALTDSDINARGEDIDIDVDQDVDQDITSADRGGIATGGDVSHSQQNSGSIVGVQAGGDVDADHAVFGNGNVVFNESSVGAFALGGDATNVDTDGGNALLGRGTINDIDNSGGGQVALGNGNRLSGDVDVDVDDVEGNLNLAIGDDNHQQALQDNSTTVSDSFNTDNSVDDSFNTDFEDSFNTETTVADSFNTDERFHVEDNDDYSQHDSGNSTYEETYESNLDYEDNDVERYSTEEHHTDIDQHTDVWGDDNDLDLDA
jgi:hypothetical protein